MDEGIDQVTDTAENHIADSSAAHAASAISFSPTGTVAATTVQAAIAEVASEGGGTPGSVAAADVSYAGGTGMSATNVEAAIDELATEKENTGHSHAAPNGLAPVGGATGQVLKKNSATNYDYSWQADATGGGGGASAAVDVTYAGSANLAATNVEAALDELDAEKASATSVSDHLTDAVDAHAATAISYAGSTNLSSTTVEAALDELDTEKAPASVATSVSDHLADTVDAHDASAISYAGGTGMSATDVEGAIDELATEKLNVGAFVYYAIPFAYKGTLAVTTDADALRAAVITTGTIVKVFAKVRTSPTTQSILIDLHLNGTTIWSTQASRVAIAVAANSGTQTTFNTTAVTEDDYLTCNIDQVGAGTAGADLTVFVKIRVAL
jgi:hypothetical protein